MNVIKIASQFTVLVLCMALPLCLPAADFGLVSDQNVFLEGASGIGYQALVIPRFSSFLGENGDLYISAAFYASLADGAWTVIPELYRTTVSFEFDTVFLRCGRMEYSDPMGIVFSGLFDGVYLALDTAAGTFSTGAWYTGLLYKETARINMTADDLASYHETFSWDDFAHTYFASRRLAFSLGWEHPALEELVRVNAVVLGQIDLNERDTLLHSQYFLARAGIPLGSSFVLDVAYAVSMVEISGKSQSEVNAGLAGEVGLVYYLPTAMLNRFKFTGIFSREGKAALPR